MNDLVELKRVIAIILRRWWLLILVTVLVTTAGYVITKRQTPVYEASVTLVVGPFMQATQLDRNDILVSEMLAQTYADVAQRQPVLQSTLDTLNRTESWQALKRRVRVGRIEGTQLLQITVQDRSAEKARITADEIARQLILLSPTASQNRERDENQQFVRQRLESLQAKIESGQQRLEALKADEARIHYGRFIVQSEQSPEAPRSGETELAGSLSTDELQELQREINTLEGLIAGWENSYTQFLTYITGEQSPNLLAVVEPANAKSRPVRPRPLLSTIIAGAVGFSLALGLIFVLEFLDDTLKSSDELSQSLGLTALGTIGRIKGEGKNASSKLITLEESTSSMAEAYRMIRSNIQFLSTDGSVKSILVTSPSLGEGTSVTAANLGIVMAQAGLETIVVDGNLRQPVLHEIFDVANAGGLTDLLRSPELAIKDLVKNSSVEHLQVLTSGAKPPNPSELLSSRRMGELMVGLNELADVIIFDSPPVLAATDAAVLANWADGVILVIGIGRTRAGAAKEAMATLQHAHANFLGAVLNRLPRRFLKALYTSDRPVLPSGISRQSILAVPGRPRG